MTAGEQQEQPAGTAAEAVRAAGENVHLPEQSGQPVEELPQPAGSAADALPTPSAAEQAPDAAPSEGEPVDAEKAADE
jgi:hypothetical protein